MTAIATFHVIRWKSMLGMAQAVVWDRIRYRRTSGLVFLRVLGTGRGNSTAQVQRSIGRRSSACSAMRRLPMRSFARFAVVATPQSRGM